MFSEWLCSGHTGCTSPVAVFDDVGDEKLREMLPSFDLTDRVPGPKAPTAYYQMGSEALAEPGPASLASGPEIDDLARIGEIAEAAGIRRVRMFCWRDLLHPEAGGSELHAANIAERWAKAGIDVRLTASRWKGASAIDLGNGYSINRPAGRYRIFPTVAAGAGWTRLRRAVRRPDGGWGDGQSERNDEATVEIWNGMPFFSPLWAPGPRVVFLHHVHDEMWDLVLPHNLARGGRFVECRLAPPVYRRTEVVTLSRSSGETIVKRLGLRPDQVHVVEPGVDDSFRPGGTRHPRPLVVAVGRLVAYKRFDRLIDVLVALKDRHPGLEAVIAGEGQERDALEAHIRDGGHAEWISLPGRIDDEQLVDLYQRAWVLASTSAYEGWGLTISEAAACGTPAVASPIAGHTDAVIDGVTGFLADPGRPMEERIDALLVDHTLRHRMQAAARERAAELTWDRTALATFTVLAGQVPSG